MEENHTPATISEEMEAFLIKEAEYTVIWSGAEVKSPLENLSFLLYELETIKAILIRLELSWADALPVLHQSMLMYYAIKRAGSERIKYWDLSDRIMRAATYMHGTGDIRKKLSKYIHNKISMVQEVIDRLELQRCATAEDSKGIYEDTGETAEEATPGKKWEDSV